jgi:DinB superfamily
MRTIADARLLAALTHRLESLTAATPRVWGTMSVQQMLAHLGDAADAVLQRRPFPASARAGNRLFKWVALELPLPWPRGIRTGADPAARILSAGGFAADRTRAVHTLQELASAAEGRLVDRHPIFGPMSRRDWHRWAYLHADHHLRQFGA